MVNFSGGDFAIDTFNQSKRDLIVGITVTHNTVPASFNHFYKLMKWFKTGPFQLGFPVGKESFGVADAFVIPEFTKGFFQYENLPTQNLENPLLKTI